MEQIRLRLISAELDKMLDENQICWKKKEPQSRSKIGYCEKL